MGRKTVHFRKRSQAEFARQFTNLCNTKSSWEVWADFVTMSATAIYCKYCHQRLFNIIPGTKGSIEIKCSRCRRIVKVTLLNTEKNKDYLAGE